MSSALYGLSTLSSALQRVVTPGAIVLDVSTDFGQAATRACALGAARVYAIRSASYGAIVREVAAANGCGDRIVVAGHLPALAEVQQAIDVVVGPVDAALPVATVDLLTLRLHCAAMFSPRVAFVPRRELCWAAIVDNPAAYAFHVEPWDEMGGRMDMSAARRRALNTWSATRVTADQLLVAPINWASIGNSEHHDEAGSGGTVPNAIAGHAEWTAYRAGLAHGIVSWSDLELADGLAITHTPDAASGSAAVHAFLPWAEPVPLQPGDVISMTLRVDSPGSGNVWSWTSTVRRAAGGGAIRFNHSTFMGSFHTSTAAVDNRVVTLSLDGHIDRFVLSRLEQGGDLDDVALEVADRFGDRFATRADARARVDVLVRKSCQYPT